MNVLRGKRFLYLPLLLTIVSFPPSAGGEAPAQRTPSFSYLSDTYDIHAGIFSPQLDTQIQVNRDPGLPGTVIHLEDVFGLPDRQARPWLEFNYRSGTHSSLRFIYFDTDRSGSRTIGKDIRFGERLYTAPSTVSAFSSARYWWLTYQHLFIRNAATEFGVSPGIMVADVRIGLNLVSSGADGGGNKEVSFVAPMPVLGLYLATQFAPRFYFRNTLRVMNIAVGDYAASLFNYTITLDFNPFRNWGIGAGYYFNLMETRKGFINYSGSFSANSSGALLYLKYFFS